MAGFGRFVALVFAATLAHALPSATNTHAAAPPPVAEIEDAYYPVEEREEEMTAVVPIVVSTQAGGCELKSGNASLHASTGDLVFSSWTVLAVLASLGSPVVVMERRFKRWGLVIFASVEGQIARLRKPLGQLSMLNTIKYDFTADPNYFKKAATDPNDYIGTRIVQDSAFGEADFLTAAKYLPPIADYVVTGDVRAPVKAVVTMDGKIKRSDGDNGEPPSWSLPSRSSPPHAASNMPTFSSRGASKSDPLGTSGGTNGSTGTQWSCYHYSAQEVKDINAGKMTQQAVCAKDGHIYTAGNNTNYPGCGTCYCCAKCVPVAPGVPCGYNKTSKMDCGYPVCDTILSKVSAADMNALAAVCDTTAGYCVLYCTIHCTVHCTHVVSIPHDLHRCCRTLHSPCVYSA
jgi:hypothetical protein